MKLDFRKNWLETIILAAILISLFYSAYAAASLHMFESRLLEAAENNPGTQRFRARQPPTQAHVLYLAPKGVWAIKYDVDQYADRYSSDPLVQILKAEDFGSIFPSVWIVSYSPNAPVHPKNYIASHPPPPAIYLFFDEEGNLLFTQET